MTQPTADLFAALARELAGEDDATGVFRRVVEASVAQIDGAERAGITIVSHKSVSTPVASDDVVRQIDEHQYTTGEGPCLTAATEREPVVHVGDLETDGRWPIFSQAVTGLGVRSMLSFQLYTAAGLSADTIGALNIYAAYPDAFSDDSVHTGRLLAAHAAAAAVAAAKADHLQVALKSRDTIGQAKGILMERFRLTPDQAFDLLIAASQRTNLKLSVVADQLAATGELVTGRPSSG